MRIEVYQPDNSFASYCVEISVNNQYVGKVGPGGIFSFDCEAHQADVELACGTAFHKKTVVDRDSRVIIQWIPQTAEMELLVKSLD